MRRIFLGVSAILFLAFTAASPAATQWDSQQYDIYAGDFNGDGRTDILYVAKDPTMPSGIAISDANGNPTLAWQSWQSNFLGIQWAGNAYKVIVADFNGDGKADILLQSVVPGNNYLLLTSSDGKVVGISQTIPNSVMGLVWSADQHTIIAGDFNGDGKADLFLQATTPTGTNAVVLADANGTYTATAPVQTWSDGYLGFKWAAEEANVFAGDFTGSGRAGLLIQAKASNVVVHSDVAFPVATYPPNMNGVVLAQATTPMFTPVGVQAWSRMSNGVDWSPLINNVIVGSNGNKQAVVILQGIATGATSYQLVGSSTGAIFSGAATALSSTAPIAGSGYHLVAGNFKGGKGIQLYSQALTATGSNYVTSTVGTMMTASIAGAAAQSTSGPIANTSAGRTAGQFSVTPTGAATYNIPIWTPPGARDIEPHLAIHYTSGGPDGVMGPGWSLTGVSAIARCGKTWASNGAPAGVTLATSDDLCLDGNRLRLIGGTQGMAGSTYFSELADFSLITANGTSGAATSFTVQGKDGRYYEYGNTATSAYSQVTAFGSSAPYVWALDKVSDRQGNSMVYAYNTGNSTLSLDTIQYTATAAAPSAFYYSVKFNYQARTGGTVLSKKVAGGTASQSQELYAIQVNTLNPTTLVRQYNLYYSTSPTTTRPLLTSVQECARADGLDCLRPTTISYQPGGAGWATTSISTGLGTLTGPLIPVDLNGDGYPDALYGVLSGTTYIWKARIATASGYLGEIDTGATTDATVSTTQMIFGSFTGNGRMQFLAPRTVSGVKHWWLYSTVGRRPAVVLAM